MAAASRAPHPVVYSVLYLPFGAMSGFVTVPLTFLATRHGLSITEGSLLTGAQMVSQWLKWTWAPAIDVTLTPKRWYVLSTTASAVGVFTMATMPMGPATLPLLLAVIAVASLVNSVVGMAIEAMMAATTPKGEEGRVSAWFQAGNLGGAGLGGGLGLYLLEHYADPTVAGGVMATLFMACTAALVLIPTLDRPDHGTLAAAMASLRTDVLALAKDRGGLLGAFLCFLPVGTGAAQGVLTQASVAEMWGAGADEVALVQGLLVGLVTVVGCFGGGWVADRLHPQTAYAAIGLAMALVTAGMAVTAPGSLVALPGVSPVALYIGWSLLYAFVIGLAYAAFTAVVLDAIGAGSGATKYSIYASLSNFPIWWVGLLLGRVADVQGPTAMLLGESALGVLGVGLFAAAVSRWRVPVEAR